MRLRRRGEATKPLEFSVLTVYNIGSRFCFFAKTFEIFEIVKKSKSQAARLLIVVLYKLYLLYKTW